MVLNGTQQSLHREQQRAISQCPPGTYFPSSGTHPPPGGTGAPFSPPLGCSAPPRGYKGSGADDPRRNAMIVDSYHSASSHLRHSYRSLESRSVRSLRRRGPPRGPNPWGISHRRSLCRYGGSNGCFFQNSRFFYAFHEVEGSGEEGDAWGGVLYHVFDCSPGNSPECYFQL